MTITRPGHPSLPPGADADLAEVMVMYRSLDGTGKETVSVLSPDDPYS
jgi:hypothetical protein